MLLLRKTPRLRQSDVVSVTISCVGGDSLKWLSSPIKGGSSPKYYVNLRWALFYFLLEIYWNFLSRYFKVFFFCNWSLICLSFIDWFMEYCPVAWQRHNTQVSVKQPTSGQRERRPSTQVSNAYAQMLWQSCSLSPCKEKAVNSSLQVAKSWMFYQDSSNWLNCSFFGLCLTRWNSKILQSIFNHFNSLKKTQLLGQLWRGSPMSRCWLLKNKWRVTLHMLWMERYKLSF